MLTGAVVEVACDESGFSGTNLLRSTEPVITHASTDLTPDEAHALITELRTEFRLSPHELKSGHFLRRAGAVSAAAWFLARLPGRARVHLIDKEFFLVTRVIDLLLNEPSYTAGTHLTAATRADAEALYHAARPAEAQWTPFLVAFEDLVRPKRRTPNAAAITRFLQARDALLEVTRTRPGPTPPSPGPNTTVALRKEGTAVAPRTDTAAAPRANTATAAPRAGATAAPRAGATAAPRAGATAAPRAGATAAPRAAPGPGARAADVLARLDRHRIAEILDRLDSDDREIPPPLEPLLPALAETILFWSGRQPPTPDGRDCPDPGTAQQRRVLVIHDEQSALTADRLTRLGQAVADPVTGMSPLAGLVMADSRADPRIQVADLLAGTARRRTDLLPATVLSATSLHRPRS
ncbi:hypothetical protein J3R03_001398 [Actinoplanes couchii]|uniref:hypothetical protein n=1 Tax=Actinoplanes couchii TaxID=403638 RepID=UPI0028609327|nr:hypothetical protein [Actinoplanes couchii]MDR6317202.1 hypothetical protein [Actinoplanes couchii]